MIKIIGKVLETSKALEEKVIGYRRKIHRTPEIKYEEHNTAELVSKVLENLEITVKRNVGEIKDIKAELKAMGEEPSEDIASTGIVGEIHGTKGSGKTVALRADMDALPLSESEDPDHLPNREGFRSKRPGIMHACGHDAHVAMLLGAAEVLSEMTDAFKGTIKLIFQPAEEGGNGAKVMRKAGVLDNVNAIFGIHVWADLESGKIKINDGPMLASADKIQMEVQGGGGHGSAPHETTDPLSCAIDIVNALYKMADREIETLDPSVISVTNFHSGTTWNVIPSKAEMEGTIRTFDEDVRAKILERSKEIGTTLANLHDLTFTFVDHYLGPPTVNTKEEAELGRTTAKDLFGEESVVTGKPDMGAEDFAYYLQEVPGCFMFLGTKNEEKNTDSPHHNPNFDLDEATLYRGTALYAAVALGYLNE